MVLEAREECFIMAFFSFFSSAPLGDEHFSFIVKDVYKEREINRFRMQPQAGSNLLLPFMWCSLTSAIANRLRIFISVHICRMFAECCLFHSAFEICLTASESFQAANSLPFACAGCRNSFACVCSNSATPGGWTSGRALAYNPNPRGSKIDPCVTTGS